MSSESNQRYTMRDEKKRRRMILNRESARRSRIRKQKQIQDLTDEIRRLHVTNNGIVGKIDEITEKYMIYASQNNVLRAQMMELTERLKSLNDVIKNCEMAGDANKLTNLLMNPWKFSGSMQPTSASSGLFQH